MKGAERRRKKNVAHYVLFPNSGHDSICQIMRGELDRGDTSVQLACKMVSDGRRTHKRVSQQSFSVTGGLTLPVGAFISKATTATVESVHDKATDTRLFFTLPEFFSYPASTIDCYYRVREATV